MLDLKQNKKFSCPQTGFTLIEMVMVLVIIGLLAAIIVPQFAVQKEDASEIFVQKTLEGLGIATEAYARKTGMYPTSVTDLTGAVPPYLKRNICATVEEGYSFTCQFSSAGYLYTATPINNPTQTWTMGTGMVLTKS